MATVLGLSFYYHDSAACIVRDGKIVAAVAEERLCRRKHTNEFPKLAVEYCLEEAGLRSIRDIDAIVFYEKPLVKFVRVLETMVANWPRSYESFVLSLPNYLKSKINIRKTILDMYPMYDGRVLFSEHHLSHAASAFFPSPFDEAAVMTLDGVGEWETACVGVGSGNHLQLDQSIHFPHSIGLLYSALTAYLGFKVNDGEWKVMGLAPYGEPRYVDRFRELVEMFDDGSFRLNLRYFSHQWSNRLPFKETAWESLLGIPRRMPDDEIGTAHTDLARSGQAVVEELILNMARHAREQSGSKNLVIAGGVGLNSVANWKIEQQGIFENVWIQPAAGDDGGALGAALYVSHALFDDPRNRMDHAYFGPGFRDDEIREYLDQLEIPYKRLDDADLVEHAADCVANGQVIGWFQGRSEFGPRSLGNRSILADATREDVKETINSKIKFREWFRPFAPSVPEEHVHEYFDVPPGTAMPFMLKIPSVRSEMKTKLPGITHADGTGRVQTVRRDVNPKFHELMQSVGRRTGAPVLVNTSFNVRGEPIVCSPQDAYNCFVNTGIDSLFLGSYVVSEKPGDEIDFDQRYKESDALEKDPGGHSNVSVPATPHRPADRVDQTVIDTHDPKKVLEFYKALPFNFYSNATDAYQTLLRKNQIKEYPNLHNILDQPEPLDVLDVGCGAGWFSNSCAIYYTHRVVGIDFNPKAVRQATAVSRFVAEPERLSFDVADVFAYQPSRSMDVINSIGVLHHTKDCIGAIQRLGSWLSRGNYLHIGLYHSYSRRPFLDHFKRMQEAGASVESMFDAFRKLKFGLSDEVHLYSWFRDQVLHPHETQHSYQEISELLEGEGFHIHSTSINRFRPLPGKQELIAMEKRLQQHSVRRLKEGYYLPGFFTVLAQKD